MSKIKFGIKMIAIVGVLGGLVISLGNIFVKKHMYTNPWGETQTYLEFYTLEKNSVDVLFLGTSHGITGFSPLEIYDKYHINSYNLSSEQQSLLTSYYWLREAFRYQKPKVVVLEGLYIYPNGDGDILNTSEYATRFAIDAMKWSNNKIEAVREICRYDQEQSMLSYYFPIIRYHGRWDGDLSFDDFDAQKELSHEYLMGYGLFWGASEMTDFQPFTVKNCKEREPMPLMLEYLNKIVSLCKDEGVELIITRIPCYNNTANEYEYLAKYAENNGVMYIDFSEKSLYDEIGYNLAKDHMDGGHANYFGAKKISDYMGKVLQNNYGIESKHNDVYEKNLNYLRRLIDDHELTTIDDLDTYLTRLREDRYCVLLAGTLQATSSKATSSKAIKELIREKTGAADLSYADGQRLAVIMHGDQDVISYGSDRQEASGTIGGGRAKAHLLCDGEQKHYVSIDENELTLSSGELQITIISTDTNTIVDNITVSEDGEIERR